MAATNKSPLIDYEGTCPVCGKKVVNKYVRSKSYRVVKAENDHHPVELEWQNPRFNWVQPQHYFVWFCPHCLYADTEDAFRKGSESRSIELIVDRLERAKKDPTEVVNRLGPMVKVDDENIPNYQALNVHLQAAAVHELVQPTRRNYETLGRLYLRISWLYKEADHTAPQWVLNHAFLQGLASSWPDIPLTETAAVIKAIEAYREVYDRAGGSTSSKKDLALLLLLGRLHERIGQLDEAADYCRVIFEVAMSGRQALRDGADPEAVRREQAAITRSMEGLQDFKEEVETKILDRDQEHIDAVMAKAGQLPIEKLLEELAARGAHALTQKKLQEMLKAASGGGSIDEDDARTHSGLWDKIRKLFGKG